MQETISSTKYDGMHRKLHLHICTYCDGFFYAPLHVKRKYCSDKCRIEARSKNGRFSYRQIAYRNHPRICNRCGYQEEVGILKVHHRDRDHDNNIPINLEILCPNCHELEHFLKKDGPYGSKRPKLILVGGVVTMRTRLFCTEKIHR